MTRRPKDKRQPPGSRSNAGRGNRSSGGTPRQNPRGPRRNEDARQGERHQQGRTQQGRTQQGRTQQGRTQQGERTQQGRTQQGRRQKGRDQDAGSRRPEERDQHGGRNRERRRPSRHGRQGHGQAGHAEGRGHPGEAPTRLERPRAPRPEPETLFGPTLDEISDDDSELGIGSRVIPPAMDVAFSDDEDDGDFSALAGLDGSPYAEPMPSTHSDMQETIRALEARLDGLIRQASEFAPDEEEEQDLGGGARNAGEHVLATSEPTQDARAQESDEQSAVEATRELLSSEYYRRQWGRLGLRRRSEHIDDFGHDPVYERRLLPLLDFVFQHYFRCETQGIDQIPKEGRCLLVANHSGTLPLDGLMLRSALRLRHPSARPLRWLAEDFLFYLPFVGVLMNRLGAVRACQENAQRLLEADALLAAFPEGTKGVKKLYRQRYQLQRFGRGGYIRLCLKTGTPLVPCAIIGAEETNPVLFRLEQLPRLVGWPYLPVTPTFPLLGPLGLLPAPTKWKMVFGPPMRFDQYGPADANDHVLVGRLSEQVQATIREMLERALGERKGVWRG